MAYNRRYNPDALPAHAEPEEAAQMMGRTGSTNRDNTSLPYRTDSKTSRNNAPSRSDSYGTRPPPPPGSSQSSSRDNGYGRSSTSSANRTESSGYDRRQPPPGRSDSYARRDDGGRSQHDSYGPDQGRRYDSKSQQQQPPPAPTPAPPPAIGPSRGKDEDELWRIFKAVDRDRSGQLEEEELGAALVNGDYSRFDPHTVKMMIRMFDADRSGTISFDEFCSLWAFLGDWRKLFDRFDVDRSGTISLDEFSDALVAFGYRLSPDYVKILFNTYDIRGRGVLSFDLFVQSCISLKRMTEVFKKYDTDRDGVITLTFEEFLAGVDAKMNANIQWEVQVLQTV